MFTHISVDLQLQFYRLATWCVITDAGRAAVSTIPVRAVFHSHGNVWPISRWLFFFCSLGVRTLGARFDAGLGRGRTPMVAVRSHAVHAPQFHQRQDSADEAHTVNRESYLRAYSVGGA